MLQFTERVVDLVSKHLAGPDSAHDAVSVFAAHGAAKLLDQVGHRVADGDHLVHAILTFETDHGADVEATHGGVAVVTGGGSVIGHNLVEPTHEVAHY